MTEFSCPFFGAYASVYTLSDSLGNVFYVGCTIHKLEKRIATHISDAKADRGNKKKNAVIRSINYKMVVTVVDVKWVTSRSARHAGGKIKGLEKKWMTRYYRLGYNLCNKDIQRLLIVTPENKPPCVGQTFTTKTNGMNRVEILENHKENTQISNLQVPVK